MNNTKGSGMKNKNLQLSDIGTCSIFNSGYKWFGGMKIEPPQEMISDNMFSSMQSNVKKLCRTRREGN